MRLLLLDTTTLTHLFRQNQRVLQAFDLHRQSDSEYLIGTTSINVEEVFGGWLGLIQKSQSPQREAYASQLLNDSIIFLSQFKLFSNTENAVNRYQELRQSKLNVGRNDLRMAALAIELQATVVTDNLRDFSRIPNLIYVDSTK